LSKFEVISFFKQDRSGRVRWLLEELGVPYTSRFINPRKGENELPDYLKLNPLGMVPTVLEDGKPMIESAAICLSLTERYGKGALIPKTGTPERQEFWEWTFLTMATLDSRMHEWLQARFAPDTSPRKACMDEILASIREAALLYERRLTDREFLVGRELTLADILTAPILAWHLGELLGEKDFPAIDRYIRRMAVRPAVRASGAIDLEP
jgi:glutathione S-transferase